MYVRSRNYVYSVLNQVRTYVAYQVYYGLLQVFIFFLTNVLFRRLVCYKIERRV